MKSIKLRNIKIENFKGAKERTIVFGEQTKICGANATGKTTIFDAFTWLLFGKDSLGNAKFNIRPLDKDGKMIDNLEISVEAVLSVDGEEYSLKKVQKQKWVKKRGTNTTEFQGNVNEFEINGYPKSEKEFKQFISGMIDEKVFNIVTNPVAFTSLPWKEQREILMQFVGESSDVEIAEAHGEKFSKLIPELKIASTDDILKKYTKAKNVLNEEMIEIPTRIDEVSKRLITVDVGALEVEKAAKEVALKKVEDDLVGGTAKFDEINAKREQGINFKPKAFNDGKIIGAFAVCLFADGGLIYDTMSIADLENTRKSSKASNSPAWKNFAGEMYKKTVLHRLCKQIELDFENPTQQSNFMAGMEIETDVSEIAHREIAENENSQPFEVVADVEAKEEPSFVTEG